jgi:uncharacterized protein YjeT (DUF2065 family)
MTTTLLLAELYAVVFLVLGLGMLLEPKYYEKAIDEMMNSAPFLMLGGMFALIAGVVIVMYHNLWGTPLEVIITLFGWIAVIKGLTLLIMPTTVTKMVKKMFTVRIYSYITILIGLIIGALAFMQ